MSATPVIVPIDPTPISSPETIKRITNSRSLLLLRVLWIALVVYQLIFLVILIPELFQNPHIEGSGSEQTWEAAERLGISQRGFYDFNIAFGFVGTLIYLALGAVLFWRSGNERTAMLFSFLMIPFLTANYFVPPDLFPPFIMQLSGLGFLLGIYGWVYLYPTGRFFSRWTSILYMLLLAYFVTTLLIPDLEQIPLGEVTFGIGLLAMAYRYHKSRMIERQQMKWLLFCFAALVFTFIFNVPIALLPASTLKDVLLLISWTGFITLITVWPIAVGFAILRYGLWNIDLVINRSLVYGAVTLLLALVFAGMIALASSIVEGQGQVIGVAGAAVISGVLFNPLRHRIQSFVDHRVFGLRYDLNEVAAAQKTLDVKNPGIYTGRTFGSYQIMGVLGKGGMGEVYKGVNDGQIAAVKVLPEDLSHREELRKRFEREAQTLAALDHPNIVKMFGSGVTDEGVHYLAMEYIEGYELSEVIRKGKIKDYDVLRDWIKTVAAALDYIHHKGLVHRDLKPSNIMLRPSIRDVEMQEAVLMDFGIARVDTSGTRITGSGTIGTVDYMSPEQIMVAREVDKRSDIYALGVILYELLTTERPFNGSAGQVLFAHLQQPAPDPRNIHADVPRSMAHAVLQALEKNPDDRFDSAGEFANALAD